jgi:hypothetical protein
VLALHYAAVVSNGECWFCGAPARAGDEMPVGMHRDVDTTNYVVAARRRWKTTSVRVPRCRRCRTGHRIEHVVFYVMAASAGITAFSLFVWVLSRPWADEWQFVFPVGWTLWWVSFWLGMRHHWFAWRWLAPKPRRYAREYPVVEELYEDGWNYRAGPR